ncbi:MAG TPA: 2-phosphosulfolactate phosphatase [Bacillota bacterium]|nr:2-phosphosulfolactate phosphatase [Bacillota bacterium]
MKVDVFPTVQAVRAGELSGRVAIAIDVLRATTTAVTALANGSAGVVAVRDPEEALALAANLPAGSYVLGGERGSLRLPGFHLGNSPGEYAAEAVAGRRVILATTNGTAAIRLAGQAQAAGAACLLNGRAIGAWAAMTGLDLTILCAGTQGEFSVDDVVCAGQVVDAFCEARGEDADLSDLALCARELFVGARHRLLDILQRTRHGRRLTALGFGADLEYAARADSCRLVSVLEEGVLRKVAAGYEQR